MDMKTQLPEGASAWGVFTSLIKLKVIFTFVFHPVAVHAYESLDRETDGLFR